MSLVESMRRRMVRAEENDVPRGSFIDSELAAGMRLQQSLSPALQQVGKEHMQAAMELAREAGPPITGAHGPRDNGDDVLP